MGAEARPPRDPLEELRREWRALLPRASAPPAAVLAAARARARRRIRRRAALGAAALVLAAAGVWLVRPSRTAPDEALAPPVELARGTTEAPAGGAFRVAAPAHPGEAPGSIEACRGRVRLLLLVPETSVPEPARETRPPMEVPK